MVANLRAARVGILDQLREAAPGAWLVDRVTSSLDLFGASEERPTLPRTACITRVPLPWLWDTSGRAAEQSLSSACAMRRDIPAPPGTLRTTPHWDCSTLYGAEKAACGCSNPCSSQALARLTWHTGATFVHDWFALGLGLLVLGHITYALKDPEARRGMRTGRVSATWARSEHPAWAEEIDAAEHPTPD